MGSVYEAAGTSDGNVPAQASRIASWLTRHSLAVFLALVTAGSLRIICTYGELSHTFDEPAHIACGMEWLSLGTYRYEPLHPPLARVAAALGPYLDGETAHGEADKWDEGLAILGSAGHYDRELALARLGMLPFFWLACLVVYLWGRKYYGEPCAALAVLAFSLLPPVLAHAGLATTDMALAATVGASFLAGAHWCERPSLGAGLVFGGCTGLAILSKFSALAFIPVSLLAALGCFVQFERPGFPVLMQQARHRLPGLCLVAVLAFLVVWAGYRFSMSPATSAWARLPFPELYAGVQDVIDHDHFGSDHAYLLGEHRDTGWWWYYLVALGVKTPLAFLALLAFGLFAAMRSGTTRGLRLTLAFCSGILLFCLFSRFNLGIRHVLSLYLGLSLIAAYGAASLLEQASRWQPSAWIASALLLALCASSLLAHPDYLAYFNILAGRHPEQVLVDSDLDWGQDLKRLARRLHQLGATQLAFTPYFPADPSALGLPPLTLTDFLHPTPGWNAVRLTVLELALADKRRTHPELRFWAEVVPPEEKIGAGIWLWWFPDHPAQRSSFLEQKTGTPSR